jgi:hypothetical protein
MTKFLIGCGVFVLIFVIGAFITLAWGVSTYNGIQGVQNTIKAKQEDNKSEFDNMWKKIAQVAQVTEKDRSSLMDIFIKHAGARTTDSGGSLAKWVQESVPNISSEGFNNLSNIIVASRDRWTMRQKELLDLKREHDNYRTKFPSNILCGLFGIQEVKVQIITSDKTDKTFETGKDNDTKVF